MKILSVTHWKLQKSPKGIFNFFCKENWLDRFGVYMRGKTPQTWLKSNILNGYCLVTIVGQLLIPGLQWSLLSQEAMVLTPAALTYASLTCQSLEMDVFRFFFSGQDIVILRCIPFISNLIIAPSHRRSLVCLKRRTTQLLPGATLTDAPAGDGIPPAPASRWRLCRQTGRSVWPLLKAPT